MPDPVEVKITGIDTFKDIADQISVAIDPDELFAGGSAILLNRIRTRFLDQESADGTKWLVSQAALDRKSTGSGKGTLFDTGLMFQSIQASKNDEGFAIGTDVPYAIYHQEGIGQETREFLGFNNEDETIFRSFVLTKIRGALNG